jgi:enediyne biosynthesis protein E4
LFYGLLFIATASGCSDKAETVFESLPPSQTSIEFINKPLQKERFNILYYLYYYNGGGVATGDVNNDGLPDIYFTANNKGGNKLYLNKGNFQFEDITDKAGVAGTADWCTGVTMADVNGDGWLDIYVSAISKKYGLNGHNELFINKGSQQNGVVSFEESAAQWGLDFAGLSTQAAFFDYDRDGDLDCYILNQSDRPHARIVDTSNRRKYDSLSGDRLYENQIVPNPLLTAHVSLGIQRFIDVSSDAGILQSGLGYGLGLAIADFNNDGWDDIYVGNDFHENDYYYLNQGNRAFKESGAQAFNHYSRFSMGNDAADFNNDGQLDLITVDMLPDNEKVLKTYGSDDNPDIYQLKLTRNGFQDQYSKNCLQRNNGNGTSFSETALLSGVSATDWSWSALFADFDNDGNKDLFVSSGIVKRPVDLDYVKFVSDLKRRGMDRTDKYDNEAIDAMPDGSSHPYLFKGDGDIGFKDVSKPWGTGDMKGYFTGAAYADFDNDGNIDLVINCINKPAVILKNNATPKNHLTITFKGERGNTSGIGAKAYVYAKGKMQYQQLMTTRGFQSGCEPRLHFGLDSNTIIQSVMIIWPDQKMQVLENVPVNKPLSVFAKDAKGYFNYKLLSDSSTEKYLIDITGDIRSEWEHRENDFFDHNVQYLIPHGQSARGPKLAVADVNKDGLDDYYACGATGQPGALMVQKSDGSFSVSDTGLFNADAACEDVDAQFFDADNDGDMDLYVASGGNEYAGNSPLLPDRLYLNDGKGHFAKTQGALPNIFINKSCVTIADIDKDGDMDIFSGVLADSRSYGIPQTSFLLINNGKGNFAPASRDIIDLVALGIVTSAQFADLNRDGQQDLIVGGEWMPLTIFINKNGKFEKSTIANSTGLWQSVYADDVNGDGNMDILAGNWGLNNKFHSGKNGPLRMYVSDFDKNGRIDHLTSYTLNGIEYPFLAKDEVEKPMPLLKKHYVLYTEYAGVPMKDVFYGWIDTIKPVMAERLANAVCLGDGKGNFAINDLPAGLQLAPIMSFQKLKKPLPRGNTYLCVGNYFEIIPYEGRYDAQPLALLEFTQSGRPRYVHQPDLLSVKGQVRDAKWIHIAGKGDVLMVARNKEGLLFYQMKKF